MFGPGRSRPCPPGSRASPKIANAIQWQHLPASSSSVYTPPGPGHKIAWPQWTPVQQLHLINAYRDACVWFECGAYSENRYLDHGDNPCNQSVKNSGAPVLSLLIDQPTCAAWFTSDATVNITDSNAAAGANIGRRAAELA